MSVGEQLFKANLQGIYRYNLTDGTVYQNNGDKQRGGAGCACAPLGDIGEMWFGGGEDDSGLSSSVSWEGG